MAEKLGYNNKIGQRVYHMTRSGVSVKDMFGAVQEKYGSAAPASLATFYKYYRSDMDRAKAEINEAVGSKVVQQALEGDFKSQELYLRSKAGWSPNETVNSKEQENEFDEAEGAMEALKRLLGKE
jgi:glycosylphosphatidylinositol transamidase (GPIT) subunit GPI8